MCLATCRVSYGIEVLKNGILLETKDLTTQPYYTFGRSPTADVLLEHPSASRLHVVLQFHGSSREAFLYDCGSTHGSYLNKNRLKARVHAPVRSVAEGEGFQKTVAYKTWQLGLLCLSAWITIYEWHCDLALCASALFGAEPMQKRCTGTPMVMHACQLSPKSEYMYIASLESELGVLLAYCC